MNAKPEPEVLTLRLPVVNTLAPQVEFWCNYDIQGRNVELASDPE